MRWSGRRQRRWLRDGTVSRLLRFLPDDRCVITQNCLGGPGSSADGYAREMSRLAA